MKSAVLTKVILPQYVRHLSHTMGKPIDELEKLSFTDTECIWKSKKPQVQNKYESQALHITDCFRNAMHKERIVNPTKDEIQELFNQAMALMPDSEFSLMLKGRRQISENHRVSIYLNMLAVFLKIQFSHHF
ncbi:hypothetical protein FQR65_LT15736 [Abscondita terminalis]|nr:hypothetical protein FQR65_LT15736 [Abscondita terminalis]